MESRLNGNLSLERTRLNGTIAKLNGNQSKLGKRLNNWNEV